MFFLFSREILFLAIFYSRARFFSRFFCLPAIFISTHLLDLMKQFITLCTCGIVVSQRFPSFMPLLPRVVPFSNGGPLPSAQTASTIDETNPDLALLPFVSEENLEINQARSILRLMGYKADIHNMTSLERSAMHRVFVGFLTKGEVDSHAKWHTNHSIGGLDGPGSGIGIGGRHNQIIQRLRQYIGDWFHFPVWFPWTELPPENNLDPKFAQFGPRTTSNPRVTFPEMYNMKENGQMSILDFEDPDDLWRWIALTIHNSVHAAMGDPMEKSYRSPFDIDPFILWHWLLQLIEEVWKQSPNGQKWVQANPNHPLLHPLQSNFEDLSVYRNQGACPYKPFTPICQRLQEQQQLVHPL